MFTKEELARQINLEKNNRLQEFEARQKEEERVAQIEAQRQERLVKERKAEFKKLGIPDMFKMIVDNHMVDKGELSERYTEYTSSAKITFDRLQSHGYTDRIKEISVFLEGDNLQINGYFKYKTTFTPRLLNGIFLWTKAQRDSNFNEPDHELGQFEATILEVVGKVVVDPRTSGGAYNNYS